MIHPLFREFACLVVAAGKSDSLVATEFETRAASAIETLCSEFMPAGGGFDCGTTLETEQSNLGKLVFFTEFHHMNDSGYYDGWTSHRVIVTPSLVSEFELRVTGRDRNGIKGYIAETFHDALSRRVHVGFDQESGLYTFTECKES